MAFSLGDALLRSADRRPDAVALRFNGADMTYAELVERSGAIARLLVDLGVGHRDRVGIYMNRSFDTMAAIFGAMRAGAAYVPFNSSAPIGQLSSIMEDCDIRYLCVDEAHGESLPELIGEYPSLRAVVGPAPDLPQPITHVSWDQVSVLAGLMPDLHVIEQDLCLIFYTSGSTGKPKGVAHCHRSMLSNVEWALQQFDLSHDDRFIHVTSAHFDLSWLEMYASIAAGGTLVLVPEQSVRFPGELAALTSEEQISVWCSVPSVLMQLASRGNLPARDLRALRWILFAGERFPTKHLRELMDLVSHPHYCNMYGTTETHIAAFFEVPPLTDDAPLPIGRACAHVTLMAVDGEGKPAGPGGTGELVIRGPSLMDGYWRLPERTASALVEYPTAPDAVGRFYRSGDLVVLHDDGNFQIIGRADRRVKVRGYLVDLDEVEKVLLSHDAISEVAAYVDEEGEASARIEAVVVLKADGEATPSELRLHVSRRLPTYAVPERVVVLDDLPRTGSGKISRRDVQDAAEAQRGRAPLAAAPVNGQTGPAIKEYIVTELLGESDTFDLGDQDELLQSGLIDSMGVAGLVAFIEDRFGVAVSNDEFVAENFVSVHAIEQLVKRLRSG